MGFFSKKMAAPAGAAQNAPSSGKSASDTPSVPVSNPGFPDGDLGSLGVKLFEGCGFSCATYSTTPIADLFAEVSRVAPRFLNSSSGPGGIGEFIGYESSGCWIAWDSPAGSAVALHCFPEGDTMMMTEQIIMPLKNTGPGVNSDFAISGEVPAPVAEIIATGRAVPVWDLPGLEALRPAPVEGAQLPELLVQRLNEGGWQRVNETLFKGVVNSGNDRTQAVFFGSWNHDNFACMSPVAHAENGQLPEALRGASYEQYRVDVVANLVMLVHLLPAGPPSPTLESITDAAVALASFADRIEADLSTSDEF